jgi:hypothetical protein
MGFGFPERCYDGPAICGTDATSLWTLARVEIPDLCVVDDTARQPWETEPTEHWPPSAKIVPPTLAILDLLEFVARHVGKPHQGQRHDFFQHHHSTFDRDEVLLAFVTDVNRLFARSGLAFELTAAGVVHRILSEPVSRILNQSEFRTGDSQTDELLARSVALFISPKPSDCQDAIEKLWDAFERVKTLEAGPDKKTQATALLSRAGNTSGPKFNAAIEAEFKALTDIGNTLRIRHSETDKEAVPTREHAEYLFVRMFSVLRYVLRRTGRVA